MADLTSSSDEEVRKKLLDAVDNEFISDGMFNGGQCRKEHTTKELRDASLPSLRAVDSDHLDNNVYGLNLTPEFQNYVGKQLAAMLDKQLKEVEPRKMKKKKCKRCKNRVKLLHGSSDYIELSASRAEDVNAALNAKRKAREVVEDSEEENMKVKEVAVTADWVSSGQAIKGWVRSTKGDVMVGEHASSLNPVGGKKKKKKNKNELDGK